MLDNSKVKQNDKQHTGEYLLEIVKLYKNIDFKKQRIVAYEKGGEGYCL